jgi:hypothetical protein
MSWETDKYARRDGSVFTEAECREVMRDCAVGLNFCE